MREIMVWIVRWLDTTSQRNRDIFIICFGLLLIVIVYLLYKLGITGVSVLIFSHARRITPKTRSH